MQNLLLIGSFPRRNVNLADRLRDEGYRVSQLLRGEEALRHLKESNPDGIVVGIPQDVSHSALLNSLAARFPLQNAILLLEETGSSSPSQDAFLDLSGMSDSEILSVLPGLLSHIDEGTPKTRLIGESPEMEQIRQTVEQVARTSMTVLITGESGTGKDVVARLLHERSKRAKQPFIAVNCAALPEGVLESELFGHEKGAFTGATARREGRFELANRGTLFLDEIGEMPIQLQSKLLRVLEGKKFLRVGGVKEVDVDVRLIAATNAELERAVEERRFRQDLYYRLNVIQITIPPLRERREDIPELISFFVLQSSRVHGLPPARFSDEALSFLSSFHWPGNVRQLRNLIEKIVILERGNSVDLPRLRKLLGERFARSQNLPVPSGGDPKRAERELIYQTLLSIRAELAELKRIVLGGGSEAPVVSSRQGSTPAGAGYDAFHPDAEVVEVDDDDDAVGHRTAADFEKEAIRRALREAGGNRRRAARILGIGERTLYRKLKLYELGQS